jgi:outer membrane protein TolC
LKKFFVIFILFVSSVQLSFSQNEKENLSIEDAIILAIKNNYSIKIAKSESQIEYNNFDYAINAFLPTLDLLGRVNFSNQNVKQEFLDGRRVDRDGAKSNLYETSANLNWTLFDGMKMFVDYSLLKEMNEVGELRLLSKIENTLRDVINTYYNLLRQQSALETSSENLSISRKRFQFINDRFEVGMTSKFELLQAQIDLNADISDSVEQNINLDLLQVDFNRLLNLDLNKKYNLSSELDIEKNYFFDGLKIENNTDFRIAKKIVEINNYDIESLKSEFYPKISLYANLNYNRQESEAGFLSSNSANGLNYGVNFSLNLFNGFNSNRQIENAKVRTEIANYLMKELETSITGALISSLNNYSKFKGLTSFENENIKSATENMELAMESLNLGLMSALEFRETQRRLLTAKQRYLSTVYSAKINETELLRLTGSLLKDK